jgi:hypothetical protein
MFIYTVRASGVKFFAVIAITLLVLAGLVLSGGAVFASAEPVSGVDFSDVKTEEDRRAFLASLGVEVAEGEPESTAFVMPENFDRVLLGYNEIQKRQGLDLSKYSRKNVTRYTYTVTNYDGYEGEVLVNLIVYRNRIIGCDISSSDPRGFIEPLVKS